MSLSALDASYKRTHVYQNKTEDKHRWGCGPTGALVHCGWTCEGLQLLRNTTRRRLKKLQQSSASPALHPSSFSLRLEWNAAWWLWPLTSHSVSLSSLFHHAFSLPTAPAPRGLCSPNTQSASCLGSSWDAPPPRSVLTRKWKLTSSQRPFLTVIVSLRQSVCFPFSCRRFIIKCRYLSASLVVMEVRTMSVSFPPCVFPFLLTFGLFEHLK